MSRFDNPHIDDPRLTEFARLAEAFCRLVEGRDGIERLAFIHRIHEILPSLYAAGLRLPTTDVLYSEDSDEDEGDDVAEAEDAPDRDRPDVAACRTLYRDLAAYFEPYDRYREVFDPFKPLEEEPEVLGSLSDDMADMYGDLVSGLKKWERGESGGALWEWRFGLEHHWGEHATGAIRALHTRAAWWDTWFPPRDDLNSEDGTAHAVRHQV